MIKKEKVVLIEEKSKNDKSNFNKHDENLRE